MEVLWGLSRPRALIQHARVGAQRADPARQDAEHTAPASGSAGAEPARQGLEAQTLTPGSVVEQHGVLPTPYWHPARPRRTKTWDSVGVPF